MRPATVPHLLACVLLLAACETYKADATPGAGTQTATPTADEPANDTPPAAAAPDKPAADPSAAASPSCDAVVTHLVAMTEKELAKLDESQRTQATAILPEVRKQVSEACASSDWSAEFKRCILGASSEEQLRACEKFAPEAAAPPAVQIPPPESAKPAVTKVDGPACDKVVEHVIQVAMTATDLPEEQREQMKAVLPQQKQLMLQACDSTPWPGALRTCLLAAKNATDIQGCRVHAGP